MIYRAKNEYAISPVIGTILLVAITVALIVIILAVSMGFTQIGTTKDVGLSVNPHVNMAGLNVIFYKGTDVQNLRDIGVTVNGDPLLSVGSAYSITIGNVSSGISEDILVGVPYHFIPTLGNGVIENARVIVTGIFSDGTNQVIYDGKKDVLMQHPYVISVVPYATTLPSELTNGVMSKTQGVYIQLNPYLNTSNLAGISVKINDMITWDGTRGDYSQKSGEAYHLRTSSFDESIPFRFSTYNSHHEYPDAHVTVTAHLTDGTTHIIYEGWHTIPAVS